MKSVSVCGLLAILSMTSGVAQAQSVGATTGSLKRPQSPMRAARAAPA